MNILGNICVTKGRAKYFDILSIQIHLHLFRLFFQHCMIEVFINENVFFSGEILKIMTLPYRKSIQIIDFEFVS